MVPTSANGQPAVAAYVRGGESEDKEYYLHTLQVFTVTGSGVARTTVFQDSELFSLFGLPDRV
jgi:RNA polymerase sigma-70 factor (ECF subfamily)